MAKYCFYYDESNNVPKINEKYRQISGKNVFVGVFVGWDEKLSEDIENNFVEMESKLMKQFNMKGEFKGKIISKQYHFDCGVNSFGLKELTIYKEYFDFLNRHNIKVHISVESQLTHVVRQVLNDLLCGTETHSDIYTLTKMIYLRQPETLLYNMLSGNCQNIKRDILRFLNDSIREDLKNPSLKQVEIDACRMLVQKLNHHYSYKVTIDYLWDYSTIIKNFELYCNDVGFKNNKIKLIIDNHDQTLYDFKSVSKIQMSCGDSKVYVGIRIADIMASMLSKFFTSLSKMYNYKFNNLSVTEPQLPSIEYVDFSNKNKELKFNVYKSMASFLIDPRGSYYQFVHDEFADDQWCFIALLNVFYNIATYEDYLKMSAEELRDIWHKNEMIFQYQHLEKIAQASIFT